MAAAALNALHHLFAHPLLLAGLALLPVLAVLGAFARWRRRRALALLGNTAALRTLLAEPAVLRRLRGFCLVLGLTALVVGSAGPQWGRDWDQPAAPGRDLVVVLDLSRSMLAEVPSRLERAKAGLVDLADTVERHGGHRLALVVFAGRARVVCPLTHDYDHFRDALTQLDAQDAPRDVGPLPDMPSGTRIGEGLRLAVGLHDPRFRGAQDILLLSDGDDPAGDDEWRAAAEEAREAHIPVHVVGVGDPRAGHPIPYREGNQKYQGKVVETRLEEKPLQEIARTTQGTYTPAYSQLVPPVGALFRERIEPQPVHEDSDDALPVYRQHYPWFLGAALALLAGEMLLGRGRLRRARPRPTSVPANGSAGLGMARPAAAATALVLLAAAALPAPLELVRRGNVAFDRGDYAAAVDLYAAAEDPIADPGLVAFNEATALYRLAGLPENAGRRASLYREAELHYRRCLEDAAGSRRASALYGLGNSLLLESAGGDPEPLREAVRAYEDCLSQDGLAPPLADDARHNLELAKLLWLQAKAAKKDQHEDDPDEDHKPPRPPPGREDDNQPGAAQQMAGTPSPSGDKMRAETQAGQEPIKTDEQSPGAGNLPPVPDRDELVPMPPEDAAAHLERATAQVLRERHEHQHMTARAPSAGVKDW
jgi:Ca-activated chloride channel family protein